MSGNVVIKYIIKKNNYMHFNFEEKQLKSCRYQ